MNIFQEGWINFKSLFTSDKYVSFKGCTTRREFWTTHFIHAIIGLCIFILDFALNPNALVSYLVLIRGASSLSRIGYSSSINGLPVLSILYSMIMFLPMLSLTVRRLHDTGHSGWLIFADCALLTLGNIFLIPARIYSMYSFAGGEFFISTIFSIIFNLASIVLSIIILVFEIKKSVYKNNKYREGCCCEQKECEEVKTSSCDCNKENKENNNSSSNEK